MKFWTRWRAKRAVLHKYEFEFSLIDLNANPYLDPAKEKRTPNVIEQRLFTVSG